jgi:DNA-binding protein H-NS
MSIDLKALNARQLQKLIDDAKRERSRQQKRAPIAKVRSKLTRMAAAEGYSLVELFGWRQAQGRRGAERQARERTPLHQGQHGRAEVPQPVQSGRNLERPRQASALDGSRDRQGPQGRGFPDLICAPHAPGII